VPLSFAITAPVTSAIGARNTFVFAGVLGAGVTLAFLFLPGVREVEGAGGAGALGGRLGEGVPGYPAAA
jgi:hypothetical protein